SSSSMHVAAPAASMQRTTDSAAANRPHLSGFFIALDPLFSAMIRDTCNFGAVFEWGRPARTVRGGLLASAEVREAGIVRGEVPDLRVVQARRYPGHHL